MPSIFIITSLILTRASVMNPLTAKEQCWSFHLRNMWISLFCRFLLASLSSASLYNIQWQNSSQAYTCRERLGPRNISKTLLGHAWLMTFVKTKAFRHSYLLFHHCYWSVYIAKETPLPIVTVWCTCITSGKFECL